MTLAQGPVRTYVRAHVRTYEPCYLCLWCRLRQIAHARITYVGTYVRAYVRTYVRNTEAGEGRAFMVPRRLVKLRVRARDRSRERVASGRARDRVRERVASGAASESHFPPASSVLARVRAHVRTYVRAHVRTYGRFYRTYVRTYLFSLLRSRTHVRARARASMLPPRRPPPLGDFPHSLGKRKRAKAFSSFPFQTPAPCLADVPGCRRMNGKVVRSIFERAPMAVVGRNAARRPYQSAIRPQVRPESWREGEGCSSPMPSRARTRARARGRARGRAGCRWW